MRPVKNKDVGIASLDIPTNLFTWKIIKEEGEYELPEGQTNRVLTLAEVDSWTRLEGT